MACPNKIMFPTLRAEMAQQGLTIQDMASTIGTNRDTAGRKLSGKSPLYLDEAFKISHTHFEDMSLEILFAKNPPAAYRYAEWPQAYQNQ